MSEKHKVGLLVGRFQPFHKGHYELVQESLRHCAHLILVIGSAQESRTRKNPFNFDERWTWIQRTLRGTSKRITVIGVTDRAQIKDDGSWGEYMLGEVERQTGLRPTINFQGQESIRSHWFDGIDIENFEIDRTEMPISATMVRKAILTNDYSTFCDMMHPNTWIMFEKMKKVLWEVENGQEICN